MLTCGRVISKETGRHLSGWRPEAERCWVKFYGLQKNGPSRLCSHRAVQQSAHSRGKPAGPWWFRATWHLLCQAVKFEDEQDIAQPTTMLLSRAAKIRSLPSIRKIVRVI